MEKKEFILKDLTGRGFSAEYDIDEISNLEKDLIKTGDLETGDSLEDWAESAEIGDEFVERTFKIIRIK